jgi:3,4-dihydroxy 2-butanone 4-phosphate synthase/GTP cyclohydrolase II
VRLHLESVVDDVFGKEKMVSAVMQRMADEGRGVVVYLREGSVGVGKSAGRRLPEEHMEAQDREAEWREIGLGAQILKDLGIGSIKLYSTRERHYVGLEGFGIRISSTEIL